MSSDALNTFQGLRYSRYGQFAPSKQHLAQLLHIDNADNGDDDDDEDEAPVSYLQMLTSQYQRDMVVEVFDGLQRKFGFQQHSADNQIEYVCSLLVSYAHNSSLSFEDSVRCAETQLLQNYRNWSAKVLNVEQRPYHSVDESLYKICLYQLIYGEAANVRFCPEYLCFLLHTMLNSSDNVPGPFLKHAIVPMYSFLRDENYKSVVQDDQVRLARRSRDHSEVINYDDVNECFWKQSTIDGIAIGQLGRKLADFEPALQYAALGHVSWTASLQKTYYERRTILHVYVNFISIWIFHVVLFLTLFLVAVGGEAVPLLGLSGLIASFMAFMALLFEKMFVSSVSYRSDHWKSSLVKVGALTVTNACVPTLWISLAVVRKFEFIMYLQVFYSLISSILVIVLPRLKLSGNTSIDSNLRKRKRCETLLSWSFWLILIVVKLSTSYNYLIRPFSVLFVGIFEDGIGACSSSLCKYSGWTALAALFILNMVLFMLDTYIWYTVGMTVFGVYEYLFTGASVLNDWKQAISNVTDRIASKLLAECNRTVKRSVLVWNSFVLSLFNDHVLSDVQCTEMIYRDQDEPPFLRSPNIDKLEPEAQRRIVFFSKSLASSMPSATCGHSSPIMSVLIPHFNEKILYSTRDLILSEDNFVALLDYIKSMHPEEWQNFLKWSSDGETLESKMSRDIIGFTSGNIEELTRMRIWASLRAQTLYRTVSGFYNYIWAQAALECSRIAYNGAANCNIVVAVQKYAHFNGDELENVEIMMNSFPQIKIAYVECVDNNYYSCLVDNQCDVVDCRRTPRYRILLPGNPILGDGKSDNQNHAVIFTRGEIIQLIDANQDNYLEECFKFSNIANELYDTETCVIGSRENIFSIGIGCLGDIAAAKEYTFGTITQRVLSRLGMRLHYGHPDFMNGPYMNSRGGISKAHKGLHLNEDIYAGMNAILRGGKIGHVEYYQCGKGRDLGLVSILGFVSKIGSGMGEQMLSREQFSMCLHLPIDYLWTFYFAHAGFHMNNLLSLVSIRIFLMSSLLIGAFAMIPKQCSTSVPEISCLDVSIISEWFQSAVSAIIGVLLISYVPWFAQTTCEFGFVTALKKIAKQFICFGPMFEVFITQEYAFSLYSIGLCQGSSNYISTGRGFATKRLPFHQLLSNFYHSSIITGILFALNIATLCSTVIGPMYGFMLFFGFVAISLIISPFFFNPRQFRFVDFILDYKTLMKWFFECPKLQKETQWLTMHQNWRASLCGAGSVSKSTGSRSSTIILLLQEIMLPLVFAALYGFLYISVANVNVLQVVLRIFAPLGIVYGSAIGLSTGIFFVSLPFKLLVALNEKAVLVIAAVCNVCFRVLSILIVTAAIVGIVIFEKNRMFLLWINSCFFFTMTRIISKLIFLLLSKDDFSHEASVNWWYFPLNESKIPFVKNFRLLTREFICKVCEFVNFGIDFFVSTFILIILFPFTLVPKLSFLHDRMLMWQRQRDFMTLVESKYLPHKEESVISIVFYMSLLLTLAGLLASAFVFSSIFLQ